MRWLLLMLVLASCVAVQAFTARLGLLMRLHDTTGQNLPKEWSLIASCSLLAINHIQHRVTDLVPQANELSPDFNVTYVLRDTLSSPSEAVQLAYTFTNELSVHSIVGPAKSSESGPVSLISGMNGVPTVSYWSTSPALSDKTTYPFFSRVIIVDTKFVEVLIEVCLLMEWRKVAIIYIDDLWGSGLAEAITTSSGRLDIHVASSQKFKLQDEESIDHAVKEVAQTNVRVIVFMAFGEDLEALMFAAERHGIVGRGYQWVSCNGIPEPKGIVEASSDPWRLQGLLAGVVDLLDVPLYGEKGVRFHESFRAASLKTLSHPLIDYGAEDPRSSELPMLCGYAYDTVWTAALAVDRTAREAAARGGEAQEDGRLDGDDLNRNLREVRFDGSTGRVEFEKTTGDRTLQGITYVIKNWQPVQTDSGAPSVESVVIAVFGNRSLTLVADPFWPGGAREWAAKTHDGECESGYVLTAAALQCEACPLGTRQQGSQCEPCPVGHHGPAAGSAVCVPCGQEGYANETGLARCHVCPANHAMPDGGAGGSLSVEECECQSGYFLDCRFHIWQVLLVAMGVVVLGISGVSLLLYCKGSLALDEEERHVQGRVMTIRKRLHVRRQDGFLLPWDGKPWLSYIGLGRQTFHSLNQKQLEAAARFSLLLEFDMDALDMLGLYLQFLGRRHRRPVRRKSSLIPGRAGNESTRDGIDGAESKQFQALCDLLLDISRLLLNPNADDNAPTPPLARDPSPSTSGVGNLSVGAAAGTAVSSEERFSFFRYKVAKLRLWDSGNNFEKLKEIAQTFMDDLRAQCDELYRAMAEEDGGQELIDFANYPLPSSTGAQPDDDSVIVRQDHPGVRAIRLDDPARKEVEMQQESVQGSACAPPSFLASIGIPGPRSPSSQPELQGACGPLPRHSSPRPIPGPSNPPGRKDIAVMLQGGGAHGRGAVQHSGGERNGTEEAAQGEGGGGRGGVYGWLKGGGSMLRRLPAAKASDGGKKEKMEGGPWVPDEEVFIVQLHLRASLLNDSFQRQVRRVVGRRVLEQQSPEQIVVPASLAVLFNEDEAGLEKCVGERGEGSSAATEEEPAEAELLRSGCAEVHAAPIVEVHAAPIKSKQRMLEKVQEYADEALARAEEAPPALPLAANILDPVRASVVCQGPRDILEHARWLMDNGSVTGLPVVRVKNKFAESVDSSQYDGYRDLMMCVLCTGERGLQIIGEIQLHDPRLYRLKLKMHKLYKVKRATSVPKI